MEISEWTDWERLLRWDEKITILRIGVEISYAGGLVAFHAGTQGGGFHFKNRRGTGFIGDLAVGLCQAVLDMGALNLYMPFL